MTNYREVEINGNFQALEQQRNEALTRVVQMAGLQAVLQAKLNEAEVKIKELEAKLPKQENEKPTDTVLRAVD